MTVASLTAYWEHVHMQNIWQQSHVIHSHVFPEHVSGKTELNFL